MSIQELGETSQPVTKRLLKTYRKTLQGLGVDVEDIRRHERYMSDPQERAQRAALEGTVDEDYALTHEDVSGLTSHLANQTDSIRSSVPSLNGRIPLIAEGLKQIGKCGTRAARQARGGVVPDAIAKAAQAVEIVSDFRAQRGEPVPVFSGNGKRG